MKLFLRSERLAVCPRLDCRRGGYCFSPDPSRNCRKWFMTEEEREEEWRLTYVRFLDLTVRALRAEREALERERQD